MTGIINCTVHAERAFIRQQAGFLYVPS
ncbi:uncharacterized protein METZ01_LOCUS216376 [marine metagenome]|uniref:Uncharacterized protein n=1 Tax=marine metagenome TaxID=408172 RepID=A0A382FLN7_9ZZZZ